MLSMAPSNVSKLFDHAAHNGSNYQNEHFSEYRTKSVQEFRFELSQGIRNLIFFATFVKNIRKTLVNTGFARVLVISLKL